MTARRWGLVAAAVVLAQLIAGLIVLLSWRVGEVPGLVTAEGRPVAGAVVRVKTTGVETRSDENGRFVLQGFSPRFRVSVTAWVDGYYIGGGVARPWKRILAIDLKRHLTGDNPGYGWIPPAIEGRSGVGDFMIKAGLSVTARLSFNRLFLPFTSKVRLGCADCHGRTIYDQYAASAHAQGTNNIRFLTMYNGTDVKGNKSPLTSYGVSRDYGRFPLRPDPNQPWYGPGFKLDFPDQAGNCASCHMPGEATSAPYNTDINKLASDAVQGTHCDFCHKIADVRLDSATNLPYENMPGVLSIELRRPAGGPQMFFGPFDDVDVGPDTYSPLQNESKSCAPCHNASFWGIPVYQSYAEWLASPYPEEGKTCQSCHMKPDGVTANFAPGRGGLERNPESVFTHSFPGAADVDLLQHTARLEVDARRDGQRIVVSVRVTNENAGHDMPTDSPLRNMILVVTAKDAGAKELPYEGKQIVPAWGGTGDGPTDYAGRPGKGYAKILEELWTGVSPSAAYWRQTTLKEDTRIPARATDTTQYEFRAMDNGSATVEAKLIFRRAFPELAKQKGWELQDIEMTRQPLTLP